MRVKKAVFATIFAAILVVCATAQEICKITGRLDGSFVYAFAFGDFGKEWELSDSEWAALDKIAADANLGMTGKEMALRFSYDPKTLRGAGSEFFYQVDAITTNYTLKKNAEDPFEAAKKIKGYVVYALGTPDGHCKVAAIQAGLTELNWKFGKKDPFGYFCEFERQK